jgi:hypothetical protein
MREPSIAPRLEELFGDHDQVLRDLTGVDVGNLWRSFLGKDSRFSQGTGAMQLLWYANVAVWADRFRVRSSEDAGLHHAPVV